MREPYLGVALTLTLLLVSGCPVTDDYYLLDSEAGGAGGGGGVVKPSGGSDAAGTSATGGTGSDGGGTAPDPAGGPNLGAGGEACVPSTERCNGHDDDCDELVDEFACLGSCSGFVLPDDAEHGYMFCTGMRRAGWEGARRACEEQGMRLAWIESEEENTALTRKLRDLGADPEILIGATDQVTEGDWVWFGGEQFWSGDQEGAPVDDRFNAWIAGTPNNTNNEDCALLMTASGSWGDRSCNSTYPYVCQQPR